MGNPSTSFFNCPNFRDMGGLQTIDGKLVKQGLLFRASHLAYLNDDEVQDLVDLGITTVFDLRSKSERDYYPNRLPEQVSCHEIEVDVGSGRQFFNQLLSDTASCESAHTLMVESYGRYITEKSHQLSHLLTMLSETTEGVIVHCLVGKDRTGVVIALLLLSLGVPRASIIENYLLSNQYYPAREIMRILEKHLKAEGIRSVSAVAMSAMETYCSAHRDYLQAAFNVIDIQYGGTEQYLTKNLGLTEVHFQNLAFQFLTSCK